MIKHFTILTMTCLFLLLYASGQITTRQAADKVDAPFPIYDSLQNLITLQNCMQYIGQDVYVLPKSKLNKLNTGKNMKGYLDFSIYPKGAGNIKENQYKPVQYEHQGSFISDYNALAGKYFTVIDVLDQTDDTKFKYEQMGLYLKLKHKENHDILYYQVVQNKEHIRNGKSGPFIFVGYFEKLKQLYKNRIFIAQKNIKELVEINSGKPVSCSKGSEWTCVDVTLIEIKGKILMIPVFVFKDSLNNEIVVGVKEKHEGLNTSISDFKDKEQMLTEKQKQEEELNKQIAEEKKQKEQMAIQSEKNATSNAEAKKLRRENLIKKYGEKNGSMIADGRVAIGMSKQMCIDSWGKPQDINRTTGTYGVHEQWVYNLKSYLYFEGDILTTIQN
jgi:hypothetical protein